MSGPSALPDALRGAQHGGMWVDERGSEVLSRPECRRLLALGASQHLAGHLGIAEQGAPSVLPVDYEVDGPWVVVRVGDRLFGRLVGQLVAFEVDGQDETGSWSVLVKGLAKAGEGARRVPSPRVRRPGDRLVRIRPDVLTGRRVGEGA
jgi:hypothetical protein